VDRRCFVKALASTGAPFALFPRTTASAQIAATGKRLSRVRPSDAGWPSQARWSSLANAVGGRLVKLDDPLAGCRQSPDGTVCQDFFKELHNPFFISDNPALTETSGWLDAWTSTPSAYAVIAQKLEDVVAAVNFARENNLRLVIKGGGRPASRQARTVRSASSSGERSDFMRRSCLIRIGVNRLRSGPTTRLASTWSSKAFHRPRRKRSGLPS